MLLKFILVVQCFTSINCLRRLQCSKGENHPGFRNTVDFVVQFFNKDSREEYFTQKNISGKYEQIIRDPGKPLHWDGLNYYWDTFYQHDDATEKICFHDLAKSWHSDMKRIFYENGDLANYLVYGCPSYNDECCSFGCCVNYAKQLMELNFGTIFIAVSTFIPFLSLVRCIKELIDDMNHSTLSWKEFFKRVELFRSDNRRSY